MRFQRCKLLFKEDFEKITKAKVLILGVGGVGGFCLDCLYRTGVKDITIVDYDTFDITNQNRLIGSEKIGEKKVKHLQTLYPSIKAIDAKITKEWCEKFDFEKFDIVIDAIDDINAKVEIAKKAHKKLISSMGSAKKTDPTKIEFASIWDTKIDPMAKKFRNLLKKEGFREDFITVFSTQKAKCKELGSFVAVTGAFGLALCSIAIEQIIKKS